MTDEQTQNAGDSSQNIQAGGDITINNNVGLSLLDVKIICNKVYDENFPRLVDRAAETANSRRDEFMHDFVAKLTTENPTGSASAADPDFLCCMLEAIKAYARVGGEDLGNMLVDLLVERTKVSGESLERIILNESIAVMPKVTAHQIAALTVLSSSWLAPADKHSVDNIQSLSEYLMKLSAPFISQLPNDGVSLRHLEYTGCVSMSVGLRPLETILSRTYPATFVKGFERSQVERLLQCEPRIETLLQPCTQDSDRFQLIHINEEPVKAKAANLGIAEGVVAKLIRIDKRHRMTEDEVRESLVSIAPALSELFNKWTTIGLVHATPTSVGLAIGYANLRRITGIKIPLSTWIQSDPEAIPPLQSGYGV